MKHKDLETQKAPNAWFAARDARQYSLANQSTYSQAQQVAAERMAVVLPMLYGNKGIHINYRQNFIAVKVDRAVVRDRKQLRTMEADWEKAGVVKRHSEQGIIYRIPRA